LFSIGLTVLEFFFIVLNDMNLFELDDHGKSGNSLVEEVGNLESPVEAVEGAAEVEILESLLSEEAVAEDPDGNGSVSSLLVGFVDLQLLLELNSILDFGPKSYIKYFLA
jgi:hypothetical protein